MYGNIQSKRSKQVDSETLAKSSNIHLGKANNTVNRTTQQGVQSCMYLILGIQYPTNKKMICYKSIPDPVVSDTLKDGTTSKLGTYMENFIALAMGGATDIQCRRKARLMTCCIYYLSVMEFQPKW